MKKLKLIAISIAAGLVLTACKPTVTYPQSSKGEQTESTAAKSTTAITTQTQAPEKVEDKVVKFTAVGDNLIHSNIYNQASQRAENEGEYDFSYIYKSVEHIIKAADIAFINQETIVNDLYKPSGYPRFSTPTDMGECLESLGFDAVSIINNHTLDVNEDGLLNSLDYWESKKDMTVFGAYRNQADMDNIRTIEKNGITFAFVGATEHTNGLKLKSDSEIKLLYIGEDDEEIKAQLQKARKVADVVVMAPHFGIEVSDQISDLQKEYSKKFADWGADVILGTQPHTIQPIEIIKSEDGRDVLLFNCLGNFISSMTTNARLSIIGMIGQFTVIKNGETGEITFSDIAGIPIISYYGNNFNDAKIVLYKDFTEEMLETHGARKYDNITKEFLDNQINDILKDYIKLDIDT